jgi:hypothetical protein
MLGYTSTIHLHLTLSPSFFVNLRLEIVLIDTNRRSSRALTGHLNGKRTMTSQRIGYIRVGSLDQNAERQLDGIHLDRVFTDKASGKGYKQTATPGRSKSLRTGDTLVVHSMDRLAHNVEDMLRLVREINDRTCIG